MSYDTSETSGGVQWAQLCVASLSMRCLMLTPPNLTSCRLLLVHLGLGPADSLWGWIGWKNEIRRNSSSIGDRFYVSPECQFKLRKIHLINDYYQSYSKLHKGQWSDGSWEYPEGAPRDWNRLDRKSTESYLWNGIGKTYIPGRTDNRPTTRITMW